MVPNVGIIAGKRVTLVIDTGLGPRNAQTALREAEKLAKRQELYLVTTTFIPSTSAAVLQARVRELKSQGKTAEEAVPVITGEFQAKYPGWPAPARLAPAVRTAYEESK